ncbi:MAG TPA: pitrilysin family protein [Polyangiaceae bacterium]|jgi:predicted Zn-dependent peptidase
MNNGELDVPFEVREHARGGRVVAVPQPHLHRAHLALYVRTGSRFESEETSGISHFLEHMLYRGSAKITGAHEVNLAFEKLGGSLYAATQVDWSVYSVSMPPENLGAAADLFAEVLAHPIFPDIEIEKGIVCEEILEDLDDEGRQVDADNVSRALIYPKHSLGLTITGTEKHVRRFDQRMLRAHHERHYRGENLVALVSGAAEPEKALEIGARVLDAFPAGPRATASAPRHEQEKPRVHLVESISSQTELRVCFRALPETSPKRGALDALMRTIDDGMSTRLYHRICDAQGLCYDVSGTYDGYEDDGVVDLSAGVQHARVAQVTGELLGMMNELASDGPTRDELDKARARRLWDLRAMRDSAEELGALFALGTLFRRLATPRELYERLAETTPKEVMEVAREIVRPDRVNVVAVGMLEGGEGRRLKSVVKSRCAMMSG